MAVMSFYASEKASAILDERVLAGTQKFGRSGVLCTILDRYAALVARHAPPGIGVPELKLLAELLRDETLDTFGIGSLERVLDARPVRVSELARRFKVDARELRDKIELLDWASKVALLDVVERRIVASMRQPKGQAQPKTE